jgi:uncharacterized protein (TIGR03000 family)
MVRTIVVSCAVPGARLVLCLGVAVVCAGQVFSQGFFRGTAAQSTGLQQGWLPPSMYGFPLDEQHPGYYGGGRYTEYYGYGRGVGIAGMPGPIPERTLITKEKIEPYFYKEAPPKLYPHPVQVVPVVPVVPTAGASVANFTVQVPPNADVWLEGVKTRQTGAVRPFVTPPLTPGKTYVYEVRARWMENGQQVEQKKTIAVQVGMQVDVKFPLSVQPATFPLVNAE